jgi:hypothetical protein
LTKKSIFSILTFIFWIGVVIIYPALISIYVTLPLFVGFSGLMLIKGIDEDNFLFAVFSFVYMLMLEVNLSLPLLLLPVSSLIFYVFVRKHLNFLKLCPKCISILTVIFINIIYFFLLSILDISTSQNSINFDYLILLSIIFDIFAAVLI